MASAGLLTMLNAQLEQIEAENGGRPDEDMRAKIAQLTSILEAREAEAQDARAAAEKAPERTVMEKMQEADRQLQRVEEKMSPEMLEVLAANVDVWQPALFPPQQGGTPSSAEAESMAANPRRLEEEDDEDEDPATQLAGRG
jgi:hypothetical protein